MCHTDSVGLQRDIATSHLETLIENITGLEKAKARPDGSYFIETNHAPVEVTVLGEDAPFFRLFSVVAANIAPSPELFETLNEINQRLTFLRTLHIDDRVLIAGELMALTADPPDFRSLFDSIADASAFFGPRIIEQFGGTSPFEQSKDPGHSTPQPQVNGYL